MTVEKSSSIGVAVALMFVAAGVLFIPAPRASPIRAAGVGMESPLACGAFGTYGFVGFGSTYAGNPLGLPAGTATTNGTITLGKDGSVSIHEVEIVNGEVVNPSADFTGTFALGSDCAFTAMLAGGSGPALVGVVVDNGNQIRAMTTIPGVQVVYIATVRVSPQ